MLSDDKIIALYCIVDDILKGIGHLEAFPPCSNRPNVLESIPKVSATSFGINPFSIRYCFIGFSLSIFGVYPRN